MSNRGVEWRVSAGHCPGQVRVRAERDKSSCTDLGAQQCWVALSDILDGAGARFEDQEVAFGSSGGAQWA